jgi:hypothetical protein
VGVVSAGVVLFLVGRLVLSLARFALSDPGEEPTIITDPAMIPAALVADARREGSLREGESMKFVFIPGGRSHADATFVADSFIVRRSPQGARRVLLKGGMFNVNRVRRPGEKKLRGLVVISRGKLSADTLYDDLGGLDITRLLLSLYSNRDKLKGGTP